MEQDFASVTRVDQFMDVLDKAIAKICHNIPLNTAASVYSQANSDDLLFIEVAFRKMLGQFREEAKEEIVRKCTEDGIFEYLKQLERKDLELQERKELQDKFCGGVVDVNKMLVTQRMRLKKQLILSMEKEIRSMEADLKTVYNENRQDIARITTGIQYLQSNTHAQ